MIDEKVMRSPLRWQKSKQKSLNQTAEALNMKVPFWNLGFKRLIIILQDLLTIV